MSYLLPGTARGADAAGAGVRRAVGAPLEHVLAAEPDAGHSVALHPHPVRHMDRRLGGADRAAHRCGQRDGGVGGDDPAGGATTTALLDDLGVLLHAVHALDDDPLLLAEHQDHLALGALALAGDHLHGVALPDLHRVLPHLRAPPVRAR